MQDFPHLPVVLLETRPLSMDSSGFRDDGWKEEEEFTEVNFHFPSVLFRQWWIPCMLSPKIRCRPLCLLDWLMFSGRTMGRGLHSSILQQQQFIVWGMGRSDGALWSWVRSRSWRIEMEKWRTEARTRGHLHSERTLWRWPHPRCLDTAQGRVSYNRENLHINIKLKKQL